MKRSLALAFAYTIASVACANAQDVNSIGTFDSWSAWSYRENKKNNCYIYSDAASKKPEKLDHGRVGFSIRRLNQGKVRSEASLQAGYEFAPRAIRVTVDGTPFTMIPRGQHAWLRREGREEEFLGALMKGKTLTIEAVSKRGNKTNYSFSLKGVTAAMRKVREACP